MTFFLFSFWKLFSCLNGLTENIFEGFLAIRMEVTENISGKFSAVRMEVNENIFQGFSMTNENTYEKQSVSQMIDLVMTIQTVTGSSKSERSSRGNRPFKV